MKSILIAVAGLSPQVITETLYALNQMNRPVHSIHVITTRAGKDLILSQMFDGGRGPFYRYLEEYGHPEGGIDFGPGNVHVVRDEHGIELADIVDEGDNTRLLAVCMTLAFQHTRDPDTAVFFSIAGGRKTMGACLTLAAQMYGRPQDRLYHVLVSPEFESCRDFYYPPKKPKNIELKNAGGELFYKSTRYARITLVPMPFFSIRSQLTPDVLDQPRDPGTLMLSVIRETSERLTVNLNIGKVGYCGLEADLSPSRMAIYAFFALRKKNCPELARNCKDCTACFLDSKEVLDCQQEITALYARLCGTRPIGEMSNTGIISLTMENYNSVKGHIQIDLRKAFGQPALEKIGIASVGEKPDTRYGLRIDKSAIEVLM